MKLGGNARFMVEVRKADELMQVCQNAKAKNIPIFVLGGGSNIIAKDEGFNGLVILIRIPGFSIIADDINSTTIKVGAGENWDSVVKRTVDMKLSGLEATSAIPGTIGASPVQNTGAYGQEIADVLQSLEAYDTQTNSIVNLKNSDCGFSYRDSIFRNKEKGRYIITSVTIKLSKNSPQPPFYSSLQKYLDDHKINIYTVSTIRNAVIDIRKSKLPDPKILPNAGSFFKNAIVEKWKLDSLKAINPEIPTYEMGNGTYKVPSGWLIEHAGLQGQLLNGIRIYDKNSLVLVNESAKSYSDLAEARNEIIGKVRDTFGIIIEQEPLEL